MKAVLTLTLVTARSGRVLVKATLTRDEDPLDESEQRIEPDEFGLPKELADEPPSNERFALPESFGTWLREALQVPLDPDVLWLHLVEPFGYLAMVPWERLILDEVGVPVVRLPSLVVTRRVPTDSLQVAVLAAVPNEHRSGERLTRARGWYKTTTSSVVPGPLASAGKVGPPARRSAEFSAHDVDRVVRAIVEGSPRQSTTVHVVTTPWIYQDLRVMWRRRMWGDSHEVTLHDPYELRERVQAELTSESMTQVPWLRLLKCAQGGQQADVVHLMCHATVTDQHARLVLADPFTSSVNVSSRYVSMPALMSILDDLGAWSLCLTSPGGRGELPQMRYVGSRVAEVRQGPIIVTDLGLDPECGEVREGYRFLFSRSASRYPRMRHGMVNCEPLRVLAALPSSVAQSYTLDAAGDTQSEDKVAHLIADDETPMWLAAAVRFVEQRQLDLTRVEQEAVEGTRGPEALALAQGIKKALAIIEKVLVERAERTDA